jgi:hypothetical protein
VKVLVPDELSGSILSKTIPIKKEMSFRDIKTIIAHKIKVPNPEDYALYALYNGKGTFIS